MNSVTSEVTNSSAVTKRKSLWKKTVLESEQLFALEYAVYKKGGIFRISLTYSNMPYPLRKQRRLKIFIVEHEVP